MPKFMSTHSVPPGAIQREQVNQLAEAAKQDGTIKPYHSYLNLSEGKIIWVMESPDQPTLAAWFKKMQMPCDGITPIELESDHGSVRTA
jgi:hypothetical protein